MPITMQINREILVYLLNSTIAMVAADLAANDVDFINSIVVDVNDREATKTVLLDFEAFRIEIRYFKNNDIMRITAEDSEANYIKAFPTPEAQIWFEGLK